MRRKLLVMKQYGKSSATWRAAERKTILARKENAAKEAI